VPFVTIGSRQADLTPRGWRAVAVTLLAVGAACGVRMSRTSAARIAVASGAVGMAVVAVMRTGAARRRAERIQPVSAAEEHATQVRGLPRITVVIAARDEIEALPMLIADLGRQDHVGSDGRPEFDLVVVDDRSTDGSGAAALQAAEAAGLADVTTIIRRQSGARPDGKGAALASIPDHAIRGAAVLVFDADARLGPEVLRRVATLVADGGTAFTARRRIAGRGWSALVQDDEQTVDAFIQRARGGLGGCPEFRGNGMVVGTACLQVVGGWRAGALTEDLDLSTRLAIGGIRLGPADDLEVWEAPTATLPAFARQRLRWAEGSIRRSLDHLPAAIASDTLGLRAKVDVTASIAQVTLPTVLLAAVADGVGRRRPGSALILVAAYLGTTSMLVRMALSDAERDDGAAPPSIRRVALTAVYLLHWVVAAPAALVCVALRRSPVSFARTSDRRLIRHRIAAASTQVRAVESPDEIEEIIRRHGHGSLLPYQLGTDKSRLATPEGAVVVWGRYGRFGIALGDPIGPAGTRSSAWRAFVGDRRARHEIPAVYQASDGGRADLRSVGLRSFRIGHEAIIDLATFDLSGSRRANLRHTITRARKGGTSFRFYPGGIPEPDRPRLATALSEIDALWSASAGPRLGFTIGRFDPGELDELAIAVASDASGRAVAFTTYRSTGIDGGWVLDLLRRRPDSAPGALEGSMAEAAFGLRETGAATLSLGLAPLAGLLDGSAVPEERMLARAATLVRPIYDVHGLAFFKGKFDPRWEPRYVAVASRADLPGVAIALVGLHVGGIRSVARGWLGGTGRRGIARTSRILRDRLRAVVR
jgi:lysylphosphatidylglycerol synthetase-like protein (DUF2156 family)